ncbi:MAG: hypothetical protein HOJ48_06805 [Desulfobacula sp.]|jgi:Pyruvate/2-oxoacid:ferredoxin oxidoreductase delta subunit|nr:hypothetical protein [Desulfobacula sp.]
MPEEWLYFIEGQFLEIVFYLFAMGMGIRCLAFLVNIFNSRMFLYQKFTWKSTGKLLFLLGNFLLPFHKILLKQPLYTILRYIFHACLFIIPVWYSGHLNMLLDTRLGWYWEPIPDEYIETATLVFIGIGCLFIARRIVFSRIREQSSFMDITLIMITLLPFITGYWYVNGTLDHISLFEEYMWYLHVFSGEVMILMAVFLFIRTRLDAKRCVGCESCCISCPTGTLEAIETANKREFLYSHYQCICCGTCVSTCPETAAKLRHEISISLFFSFIGKKKINEVVINTCAGCGKTYAPDPQIEKINQIFLVKKIASPETLSYCGRCKKLFSNHMLLPRDG